jgi:arylsulfatase A-like enzyme
LSAIQSFIPELQSIGDISSTPSGLLLVYLLVSGTAEIISEEKRYNMMQRLARYSALLIIGVPTIFISLAPDTNSQNLKPQNQYVKRSRKIAQPNIVFIIADDLDKDAIAYMPNLQYLLVQEGMSFQNFIVSTPLCCPSRTTILRGQYSHNTGILNNAGKDNGGFPGFYAQGLESSTITTWLQAAGFRTALIGKYLNSYPFSAPQTYIPPGWTQWQGIFRGPSYFDYRLNANGTIMSYGSAPYDYSTDVLTRKSVKFITDSVNQKKPFFLHLSYYAPHSPAIPAPRHTNLFPGVKVPRTPAYDEADVSDKPYHIQQLPRISSNSQRRMDNLYRKRLQALQSVDQGIQTLVDTLQAMSQLDNTYIFFASDNGFHLGQHRLLSGKTTPYEEDIRVPLIVRGPKVLRDKRQHKLVGNVDLAVTFADLAGITPPSFCDGVSFKPLLKGAYPSWRKAYLIAQWPTNGGDAASATDDETPDLDRQLFRSRFPIPEYHGVRTKQYTYVEYSTGERELYNVIRDPYQLKNIASTADPNLLTQLSKRVAALKTCSGASCRAIENRPFINLSESSL